MKTYTITDYQLAKLKALTANGSLKNQKAALEILTTLPQQAEDAALAAPSEVGGEVLELLKSYKQKLTCEDYTEMEKVTKAIALLSGKGEAG